MSDRTHALLKRCLCETGGEVGEKRGGPRRPQIVRPAASGAGTHVGEATTGKAASSQLYVKYRGQPPPPPRARAEGGQGRGGGMTQGGGDLWKTPQHSALFEHRFVGDETRLRTKVRP